MTPISTVTNTALTPIAVFHGPDAIAITPDGKTAYVTCVANGGAVLPIDTATNTVGQAIFGGAPRPDAIAITPDGKTAHVISGEARTVTPISTANSTALKPIKVGHDPAAIAITP